MRAAMYWDIFICTVATILGGTAFGYWQHSFLARVFAGALIHGLEKIAFAIEYKETAAQLYKERWP